MIENKLDEIQKKTIELASELNSLVHMIDDLNTKEVSIKVENIKIVPTADDYHGCYECVHSSDPVSICILHSCKHAVNELKECYIKR